MQETIKLRDSDFHNHLRERMLQRGVTKEEMHKTLNEGWKAGDARHGTIGKVYVFAYNNYWEKKYFEEKEVSVYYKQVKDRLMFLTVKARYGKNFPREGEIK